MTARNVLVSLVLALVVVGPAAAGNPRGDRTPPTTPTNLQVRSVGQTSIRLAWSPSTDTSSFSYSINVNGLSYTVPQTSTTYTLTSLSPGRTYSFYVTAVDQALNTSGRSNTVTATTLRDTSAPTAPELTGIVRGPSQVMLTWTRSTDDITWWSLGYRVFVNGVRAECELVRRDEGRPPAPQAGHVVHVHRPGGRLQRQHDDEQRGHADHRGEQ